VRVVQDADGFEVGVADAVGGFDGPAGLVLKIVEQAQQRGIGELRVVGFQPV
jgi:hypothetical protein